MWPVGDVSLFLYTSTVQKHDAHEAGSGLALGPLPALPTVVPGATSPSRARVLAALTEAPEPLSLAALSEATTLHVNTLREHLDALQQQGLVSRALAEPHGRGRPAWLYTAARATAANGVREYAGLASALAAKAQKIASFTGIEIDPEYLSVAKSRLNPPTEPDLFG